MSSEPSSKCAKTSPPMPPFSNAWPKLTKPCCSTMARCGTSIRNSARSSNRRLNRPGQKSVSISRKTPCLTESKNEPSAHEPAPVHESRITFHESRITTLDSRPTPTISQLLNIQRRYLRSAHLQRDFQDPA